MTTADILLMTLGTLAVGSALWVVTTPHVVRAGLWLVVALGAVAGCYLILTAEFVAWVQVLIYVGAVVVLLLFATMLTRAPIGPSGEPDRPRLPAALVGVGAGGGLATLLAAGYRWREVAFGEPGTADRLGTEIFASWVLPFEVLSILLLSALVGAIVVSRGDRPASGDRPTSTAQRVGDKPTASDRGKV